MTVNYRLPVAWLVAAVVGYVGLVVPVAPSAQTGPGVDEVTFAKDIAPILQRSCQNCHQPDSVAPMSLITYEDVRPWARAMKMRTGLGTKRGAMPPWFIDKNIGIQRFKNDPSLSDEEIAKIAKWADSGAPRGNPADMPRPLDLAKAGNKWTIGEPDLVVRGPDVIVPAVSPDRWGPIGVVPTGLAEDRYVSAVEIREVNDIPKSGGPAATVGGRFVFHHLSYASVVPDERGSATDVEGTNWPTHEVGRNADIFASEAGRLMAANSVLDLRAVHLHANGRETKSHLEFGWKFFPRGYKPLYPNATVNLQNTMDMDVKPNQANQELHAYTVLQQHTKMITFEPHMHAPGVRMCLEAIWGSNIQQLSCAAYDHGWVRVYEYEDDAAPLLPKGTILHLIGFLDTTPANRNPAESRNWAGSGRRSIASMFNDINYSVVLTEEQFQAEMAKRRQNLKGKNDYDIGCPLCQAPPVQQPRQTTAGQGNQ